MTRPKRAATLPPGISRVDDDASRKHGYIVRLGWTRTRKGGPHNKPKMKQYFGDHAHGGERAALRAAVVWAAKFRLTGRG